MREARVLHCHLPSRGGSGLGEESLQVRVFLGLRCRGAYTAFRMGEGLEAQRADLWDRKLNTTTRQQFGAPGQPGYGAPSHVWTALTLADGILFLMLLRPP